MEKYFSKIDEKGVVARSQEYMRIPTPNPPADYSVIAPLVQKHFEELGLEVRCLEGQKGKPNIVALWRGSGGGPTLLIDAHMDVVDAGPGWEHDPWGAEIVDGVLWGRGAADMKPALATLSYTVKALQAGGFKPKGNLIILASNDDETAGKMGTKYVLEEGLKKIGWPMPNFHFLLEASDWEVNEAYKGRVWIRVTVEGKSAHGGKPQNGLNAIEKVMALIPKVLAIPRKSHPLIGADTINVGTINGGDAVNKVPAVCEVTFDYRFVPGLSADQAIANVRGAVDAMAAQDPDFKVIGFEVFEKRNPFETPRDMKEMVLLHECITEVRGKKAVSTGTLSAGNTYWSLSLGIPASMTGPGDANCIHTSRECITIKDIIDAVKISIAYAVKYIG